MTSTHVCQRSISCSGVGKPVKRFPVFGQQGAKRIAFCQADTNAVAFIIAFRYCGEIMSIAEHEAGLMVHVGVDFQGLLRPNSG